MTHFEAGFQTQDNLHLYCQGWEPDGEARAVIGLVHGLGEHSGRYVHMANFLNQAGYTLLAFDLRGHGKSQGQRGHIPSFEAYMDDIDRLIEELSARYPDEPRFLYGHSMGGLLVLNYVLRRKPYLAGVVVTGPALRTSLENQTFKKTIVQVMGSLLPTMTIPSGLEAQDLSRDPRVVEAYRNDPLIHDATTLGWAKAMLPVLSWTMEQASDFPLPLLIMHGTQDRLNFVEGSQEFAQRVPDCQLRLWENCYHEIHNEPEQEEVFTYLSEWLDSILNRV